MTHIGIRLALVLPLASGLAIAVRTADATTGLARLEPVDATWLPVPIPTPEPFPARFRWHT